MLEVQTPVATDEAAVGQPPRTFLSETSSITLDLIRALSSQAVVVGHTINLVDIFPFARHPHAPYMQNVAVVVFFLLSGLLITYSVMLKFHDQTFTFRAYFIDRFARIYSGYLPVIAVVMCIDAVFLATAAAEYTHANAYNAWTLLGNLFMLQDYPFSKQIFEITSFGSARPFWTLAIEWWIYMAFGWLTLVILRARANETPISVTQWLVMAGVAIIPLYNLVSGRGNGLTLVWLMGLIICFALAAPWRMAPRPTTCYAIAAVATLFAAARVQKNLVEYDSLFAGLLAWALFFLLLGLQHTAFRYPERLKRVIKYVAGYSFTLYLVHYSLNELLAVWLGTYSPYLIFLAALVGSNLAAAAIAALTETRHRQLAIRLKQIAPRGFLHKRRDAVATAD